MKKSEVQKRLANKGYKVTGFMQGGYMATKAGRTYTAETLNELYNKINAPL